MKGAIVLLALVLVVAFAGKINVNENRGPILQTRNRDIAAWYEHLANPRRHLHARDDDSPQMPASNGTIHFNAQVFFMLDNFHGGMPHSYFVPNEYWRSPDYLKPGNHPIPLDSKVAIEDRVATAYGLNLYDASTWEVALSLQGEVELPRVYERLVLYPSSTGSNPDVGGLADIRSDNSLYTYGADQTPGNGLERIPLPLNNTNPTDGTDTINGAFFFRMISSTYITEDPLIGSYAMAFRYPDPDTSGPSWNTDGVIIWNDWKPITGENVWGGIIGPMQNLYILHNGSIPMFEDFDHAPPQVQFSLSVLPALMALQSPLGSLYHCPLGTQMYPPDENEATNVSNENNFSGFAAVNMLLFILKNNTNTTGSDLEPAMEDLQSLSTGLETWFIKYGLSPPVEGSKRVFYQGGHVNFTGDFYPVPIESDGGFAVDCQTWGSATLGADFIDNQIAGEQGTAYNIWQQTKEWAGHYIDDKIAGVGYTITEQEGIWSSEWSWGAVLATRELASQYEKMGCGNCASWASDLKADSESMTELLQKSVDDGGMLTKSGGYLYCNQRYFIPWGWYANAIPSLCSTAWAVMNDHQFNPFFLGGGPNAWYYQPEG